MKRDHLMGQAGRWCLVLAAAAATVFPFYWLAVLATRDPVDALDHPQLIYLPDLSAFASVWSDGHLIRAVFMSCAVTALTVALVLAITVPAAYGLVRKRIRRRVGLVGWLLVAYLLPDFLVAIPMYALLQNVGLYDNPIGLSLVYQAFMAPLAMWLLLRFFQEVPAELAEAAIVDGCGDGATLVRVYLPLVMPGVATTAIIVGMLAWNEVTVALALTIKHPTLPIMVSSFKGYASIAWDQTAAASLLVTVPVFVFALFAQKRIVAGLTAGIGK
ncbi:MAG: carbohydrate ABC transporter permease [Bifidobacteriaceae bacterium]|jgi:multiple sugar transport system permease protein|nr:carbohydrate ABC transporter permease [Bifidobacteriaceae bacterium]